MGALVASLTIAEEIEGAIAPPSKQKVGDFALPAFPFAKKAKAAPPAIAKHLAEKALIPYASLFLIILQLNKSLHGVPVTAEGPYVNIALSPAFVAKCLMPVLHANPTKYALFIRPS